MILKITSLVLALLIASAANAAGEKKIAAGPKGGRLLENTTPKAEFLVNAERKAEINFYNGALQLTSPGERVVAVTAEKNGRQALEMRKTATGFVSAKQLPAGDPYRVVVQLRERAGARPQNFRINLDLAECGECNLAEYACICGH